MMIKGFTDLLYKWNSGSILKNVQKQLASKNWEVNEWWIPKYLLGVFVIFMSYPQGKTVFCQRWDSFLIKEL